MALLCTHPPYPVLWCPGVGLPGSRPGHVTLPGLAPWRVACGVSGTCGWQRFTWRRAHVPHGVGSPGVCASLMFRHLAGTGPHRRPLRRAWLPVPLARWCCLVPLWVSGGPPPVRGALCLTVAAVRRVGTHTGRVAPWAGVALSPRCAALQRCCRLPQLRVGTSLASADCQWGTLVATADGSSRVGIATWWWLPARAVWRKKRILAYTG